MPIRNQETSHVPSPVGQVGQWARQGIESFVEAQKILFDLTAQQNALVMGMLRKRLTVPKFHPGDAAAGFVDKGVKNFATAGKILLELAADETALVLEGVKGLRLPGAATVANMVGHRVDTLIDLQKGLLDAAAEETHALAESYRAGKGFAGGAHVAELARRGIDGLVKSEKKFLDLAAHEMRLATKAGKDGAPAHRAKAATELARDGVDKYIEAQEKLLDLAIDQLETTGKAVGERAEAVGKAARTSFVELAEKSVHNLVTAQKSLLDLAAKPSKVSATEEPRKTPRPRQPKRKNAASRVRVPEHEHPSQAA
jgi:hypothetical protein